MLSLVIAGGDCWA